ncbi:hypothetical protein LTR85_008805 [Meristemomyces frigidus]|nr:hypothetical protein LTR85_008805 [Meristemomyces frigidus]
MTNVPQPETAVLAPLDPSVDNNPDDWPEYELTNARVHLPYGADADPDANVSLLLATEHHPLTVVGQLQPVPQELADRYCGSSTKRTDAIEVNDVKSFAYGQFSDGSVALWAAGRAGWFALKPSRAYRDVYNSMVEAVKLLYFVADAYREPRRSGKGKNAAILPEYTAKGLFEKYAAEVKGDPDVLEEAEERIYGHRDFMFVSMLAGKEGMYWAKNPLYLHLRKKFPQDHEAALQRLKGPSQKETQRARQQSLETGSTTSSLKRKRGRPPAKRATDVISLDSSSAASSVVKSTQAKAADASKLQSAPKGGLAVRRARHNPSAPITETTVNTPTAQPATTATPILEISDSEDEPPQQAHKGKSALRPRPSKGASKGGKGKAPVAEDDGDDGDDDKEAAQSRSSPIGGKRKLDEPAYHRQRKRRSSKQEVDEGIDIPESPSASEPNEPLTPDATSGATDGDLATRLNHAPDPVQEDTWLCALDGCTHKVYMASEADSQRLIREHYALHAYDDDQRVQMVRKLQAPSLPVNHLMEKVRLQAKIEGFPGSRVAGTRFPEVVPGVLRAVVQRY